MCACGVRVACVCVVCVCSCVCGVCALVCVLGVFVHMCSVILHRASMVMLRGDSRRGGGNKTSDRPGAAGGNRFTRHIN